MLNVIDALPFNYQVYTDEAIDTNCKNSSLTLIISIGARCIESCWSNFISSAQYFELRREGLTKGNYFVKV